LFRVASVLTLVDAVNWESTFDAHDESVRQVALADRIILTKLDLIVGDSDAAAAHLHDNLRRINPTAQVEVVERSAESVGRLLKSSGFDAANPGADPRPWLNVEVHEKAAIDLGACNAEHGHGASRQDDAGNWQAHDHLAHLKDRGIESFVLTRDNPLSREELQFLLDGIGQNLGAGLLRVKGLVNIAEEPGRPAVIQGAQHLLHTMTWLDRWPDEDKRTRIVFITQGIVRERLKETLDLLDRFAARTFRARAYGRAGHTPSRQPGP
jgi:G3E family GTPase